MKCHCKRILVEKKGKGRTFYECPKCGCIYAFAIARMSNKCANKMLKLVPSEKPKKRGRPKKRK